MQTLVSLFGSQAATWMRTALLGVTSASTAPSTPRDWYDVLRAYNEANGLYQVLRDAGAAAGLTDEPMRGIRNPAFRATEFYAAHVWPGALPDALPIVTENDAIVEPIQQVWRWSNWGARKQVVARQLALYGDWFVKVRASVESRRVWFQNLEPRYVTDFEKDDRGFVTYIRLDIPKAETDSAGVVTERWSYVEVWDKASGTYRQWHHAAADSVRLPVEQLTGLEVNEPLTAFGVDFIPIVHAPFRDVGDARGVGCFVPVIDKIDEVNRIATRLHQMGFRNLRNVWATTRTGTDPSNRPLAPVNVGAKMREAGAVRYDEQGRAIVNAPTETFIDLPGATDLKSLVPALPYADLLEIVRDHMSEIEADLPEIRWYRLAEQGANMTGRAIRLLMAPAEKRVIEARGNAETALTRADEMALTMGAELGLWSVGTYERGDFEHSFAERSIFPLSDIDEAEAHRARAQAAQGYTSAGVPLMTVLTDVMDKTEEDARKILTVAAQDADAAADRAAGMFDVRDNQGQGDSSQ